jgi:hypothetical protein
MRETESAINVIVDPVGAHFQRANARPLLAVGPRSQRCSKAGHRERFPAFFFRGGWRHTG